MSANVARIVSVLQDAAREWPSIRSFVRCGSHDAASDLDLYVLLADAEDGPDFHGVGRWVRDALAEAGIPRCQPFVLPRHEFLAGRRASCNGRRSLAEGLRAELSAAHVVAADEEVFDEPDYSLTKVAWSYVTASVLAGEDVSRAIAAARLGNGVTRRGCETWLLHSYLMSVVDAKTMGADDPRLPSKLGKAYVRMAYSLAVRALVDERGEVDERGDRVVRATPPGAPHPNLLAALVAPAWRGLPMDVRYARAVRESPVQPLAEGFSSALLQSAHRFRSEGQPARGTELCRLRDAIGRLARPFLPTDVMPAW